MEMTYVGRYALTFDASTFSIKCPENTSRFSGLATSRFPKLYVISVEGHSHPVYVGITKQSMSNRLRIGWAANGKNGYHGYAWRRHFSAATMDIWCQLDAIEGDCLDIETVEAELVFLIRQAGQWPAYQTEIHFHQSTDVHRQVAATIGARFGLGVELEETELLTP
ncbi:hypothetical protein [Pseudomonas sp. PONIH3]|uniref:hypothetical protein n=1 Tax=Pseudomonas sp. PONIH3 TaxID=1636610 RepID=UPI003D2E9CEB